MLHHLLTLGTTLFATSCLLNEQSFPKDYSNNLKGDTNYDFIIIGAGGAGCALANKLSEDENARILLIEAGDYPPGNTEVPGLFFTHFKSYLDWSYENEPTPGVCLGYENQRCTTIGGKVLGGSTTINGMLYTRALPESFDNWANMGNQGWDFESLRKYYYMFEGSKEDSDNYGKNGPLTISLKQTGFGPIRELISNASKELGIPWQIGSGKFGFVESYTTTRDKKRCSAAKAYLDPIRLRPNLFLSLNTLATKILFKQNVATGVKVQIGDNYINLSANREVIVSAGTIESPKLLMLSGIGPKDHLTSLGIKVVADLPVGQNYQDHFVVPANIALIEKSHHNINFMRAALEYCINRDGFLAENAYNIQWFINTKNNSNQSNTVIEFLFIPKDSTGLSAIIYKNLLNINDATIESLRKCGQKNNAIQLAPILTSPSSRGEVLLKSTDPLDKPYIFGNYLSDPNGEDLEAILDTMEYIRRFLSTKAMRSHNMKLYPMDIPNCRKIPYDTRDYWRCYITNLGAPAYHPVGTCKMAPHGDPSAVVTPDLKVVGLDHIRVIDASIMPKIVDRNLMSSVNVIAHKGAELVIKDWINNS